MSIAMSAFTLSQYSAMTLADYNAWILDAVATTTVVYEAVESDVYLPGAQAADVFTLSERADIFLPGAQESQ